MSVLWRTRVALRRRAWRNRALLTVVIGIVICLPLLQSATAKAAGPCGPPVVSVIACENSLPGDPPSDWQVSGSGDASIQGFATA